MNEQPVVTLLSWTSNPLETVYSVWEASKTTDVLLTPQDVKEGIDPAEVEKLFRAVIAQHIPIGEHINFVFMLENISVSWREHAVRHRIGTVISPERLGADIVVDKIPDLASSSWWSQSMRIQSMEGFASRGEFRLPQTVIDKGKDAELLFKDTMHEVQRAYEALVAAGVPMEDARELIPIAAQHRISWSLNISSLQHILSKRGCWILQLGIWGPIITGMVKELVKKVHPVFSELVTPPCLSGDDFTGCVYHEECRRRLTGDDALPPCPLHLSQHVLPSTGEDMDDAFRAYPRMKEMEKRAEEYRLFWGRNPFTGKREV